MAQEGIDFATIAETMNLPAILAAEGIILRNGKGFCPFHDNSQSEALSVFHRDGRWRFHCHGCKVSGDAVDWRALRDNIPVAEAARVLGGLTEERRPQHRPPHPKAHRPAPKEPWQDHAWQATVDTIVGQAETVLWSAEGRPALNWLRARCLDDHTIRRFRLGFLPGPIETEPLAVLGDGSGPVPIKAPRGITLPWLRPGSWYSASPDPDGDDPGPRWVGANVRRLADPVEAPLPPRWDKCHCLRGSRRGYPYPFADLTPGVPCLLTEGEWDALIAWQQVGHRVNVMSIGGAGQSLRPEARSALATCPLILVALHNDEAGRDAALALRKTIFGHKVRRAGLPAGVDLNDFHKAGGDVARWLAEEMSLIGWPPRQ